jgi:hypothetical protein
MQKVPQIRIDIACSGELSQARARTHLLAAMQKNGRTHDATGARLPTKSG